MKEYFTVRAALAFGECKLFLVEAEDLIGAVMKGQEMVDQIHQRVGKEVDPDVFHEPHICEVSECGLTIFDQEWLDSYVAEVKETVEEHEED
jgi:hypothetical protein